MKTLVKRTLIVLAGLVILVALFYAEEDWRGKRAWEKCKAEFEAKGEVLDWNAYIPPSVPDDQNFFKAPKMTEWFVKTKQYSSTNELTSRMTDRRTASVSAGTNSIIAEADARSYLAWSDQFDPYFDLIREALKRPYARMEGDYSDPLEMPIPNFVAVRCVAQVLAQRTHCYLLLGQPEKALDELTFLNHSRRLLEAAPTGQPMTLVAAMMNVAIAGLYTSIIADGLRLQTWREPQLIALQEQLKEINLPPVVAEAIHEEPASFARIYETAPLSKIFPSTKWSVRIGDWLIPCGWIYQNLITVAKLEHQQVLWFDLTNNVILPDKEGSVSYEIETARSHFSPYTILAAIAVPNFNRASQTIAHNQTLANEAQIVCALERYRLAHGEYPETLDVLMPLFIEKLPHDIIGGAPLHYRRTDGRKFLLYSVGWNETDDGGQVVLKDDGSVDRDKGDWVWKN